MVLLWLEGETQNEEGFFDFVERRKLILLVTFAARTAARPGEPADEKAAAISLRMTAGAGGSEARSGLVTFALGSGRELIRPRKGVSV